MNTSNLKDTLSTICGIISVVGGIILSSAGASLPATVNSILGILVAASVGIIAYLTGKKPDGTTKSVDDVKDLNAK